jgi:hypothetical protein
MRTFWPFNDVQQRRQPRVVRSHASLARQHTSATTRHAPLKQPQHTLVNNPGEVRATREHRCGKPANEQAVIWRVCCTPVARRPLFSKEAFSNDIAAVLDST